MKFFRKSLMLRYFFTFCSVLIIPVVVILYIYSDIVAVTEKQAYDAEMSILEQGSKAVGTYLIDMQNTALNLKANAQVNRFFVDGPPASDPDCITDVETARHYLVSLLNFSSAFDDVFVYSQKSGMLITREGSYSRLEDRFLTISYGAEGSEGFYREFLAKTYHRSYLYNVPLSRSGGNMNRYFMYIDSADHSKDNGTGTVLVLLNNDKILANFSQLTRESGAWLSIYDKEGGLVAGSNAPADAVMAEVFARSGNERGYFTEKFSGADMFITYVRSGSDAFSYYSAVPLQSITSRTAEVRFLLGGLIILAVVSSVLLVFFLSLRSTRPIDRMVSIISGKDSGKKELSFSEANEKLQNIVQDNESMKGEILTLMEAQRKTVLYRLLTDQFENDADRAAGMAMLRIPEDAAFYAVVIAGINDVESKAPLEEISAEKLLMNRALEKAFPGLIGYYDIDFCKEAFVLTGMNPSQAAFMQETERCADAARRGLDEINSSVTFAGGVANKAGKLHTAYEEARCSLNSRSPQGNSRVLWARREPDPNARQFSYPIETESRLIESITQGNVRECRAIFSDISRMNFEDSHLPAEVQTQLLNSMISTLYRVTRVLPQYQARVVQKLSDVTSALARNGDPSAEFAVVRRFCIALAGDVNEQNTNEKSRLINEILTYIGENFCDPMISLTKVAGEFGITEIYLSRLFKEQTGGNFSKYVEKLRMEKAQKLLLETDLKVSDISKEVGYSYAQVFNRVYKRYYGKTPSEIGKRGP